MHAFRSRCYRGIPPVPQTMCAYAVVKEVLYNQGQRYLETAAPSKSSMAQQLRPKWSRACMPLTDQPSVEFCLLRLSGHVRVFFVDAMLPFAGRELWHQTYLRTFVAITS